MNRTPPPAVLLLGVPGSGKTSVAQLLARRCDGKHLAASQVLRDHAVGCPTHHTAWSSYWATGTNAPDDEVSPVLWEAYATSQRQIAILDGYPRTTGQLLDFVSRGGFLVAAVILELDDSTALGRVQQRAADISRDDDERSVAAARIARERSLIESLAGHQAVKECVYRLNVAHRSQADVVQLLTTELTSALGPSLVGES